MTGQINLGEGPERKQLETDRKYMKEALRQAKKAKALKEVPIGCVIVLGDRIIARGYNRRNTDHNVLSHAETNALKKASRAIGDWRLEDCTLYVTLEPCQMCAGAIVQARVKRVVIGAMNPKAGCAGSVINLLQMKKFNHQVDMTIGVMKKECSDLLTGFFEELRSGSSSEEFRRGSSSEEFRRGSSSEELHGESSSEGLRRESSSEELHGDRSSDSRGRSDEEPVNIPVPRKEKPGHGRRKKKEKTMFKVILWDIDGTLLNFLAAEKAAIRACFEQFGLGECTDEMIARYSKINKRYWEALERGEITKERVLVGRYEEFFTQEGIDPSFAGPVNAQYQIRLGDTCVFFDHGDEVVRKLKGHVLQFGVTNGTETAQMRKLKNSGLGELFDGVFISDRIGAEKPSLEFFDAVFKEIDRRKAAGELPEDMTKDDILIVGDSLTSDIRGGNNAGIPTCWYNPDHKTNDKGVHVDYEISELHQVLPISGVRFKATRFHGEQ